MKKYISREYYVLLTLVIFVSLFLVFLANRSFFVSDDFTMLDLNFKNYKKAFLHVDLWWRPIKSIFYNFFNKNFYLNTNLIIISKIILHLFLTIIIFFYLIYIGQNKKNSVILSFLFYISQTSVLAVIGIDTLDQILFTIFGILSFIFLDFFLKNKKDIKNLILSFFFYVLALLAKESAIIFFFINSYFVFYHSKINFLNKTKKILNYQDTIAIILLFLSFFLIYFLIRSHLGATWIPDFGENRTNFAFKSNLIYNIIYYFFSIINPIDNTFVYFLFIKKYYLFLLIILIILLTVYYLIFSSLKFNHYLILFLISSVPTIFLKHISELYTYVSVFFFILFISDSLSEGNSIILNKIKKLMILILAIINLFSFSFKTYNMTYLSSLNLNFFNEMNNQKFNYDNKKIYFQNNQSQNLNYSTFKISNLNNLFPIYVLSSHIGYNLDNLVINLNTNDLKNIIIISLVFENNFKYFNDFLAKPYIIIENLDNLSQKKIFGYK